MGDKNLTNLPQEGFAHVGWRQAQLREIFIEVPKKSRQVNIEDAEMYRLLTVSLYAHGIRQRSEVRGNKIGSKFLYKTEAGDFVVSKIDARNGAWGCSSFFSWRPGERRLSYLGAG